MMQRTEPSPARAAALRRYARAHDRFSEREQLYANSGAPIAALGARIFAQRIIRAWLAERDDPTPKGLEP